MALTDHVSISESLEVRASRRVPTQRRHDTATRILTAGGRPGPRGRAVLRLRRPFWRLACRSLRPPHGWPLQRFKGGATAGVRSCSMPADAIRSRSRSPVSAEARWSRPCADAHDAVHGQIPRLPGVSCNSVFRTLRIRSVRRRSVSIALFTADVECRCLPDAVMVLTARTR